MNRPLRPLPADRARGAFLRALKPLAGPFALIAADSRPWASATFEGARHRLALKLEGDDVAERAKRLQATLGEADLSIAGGFVADIVVEMPTEDHGLVLGIEALTIDEA
ncbi:MAG: hypothetical protein JWO65_2604 [Sphingomonas bacterium]|nr:hypothetical protein [Sphingomonas bacterium]